SAHGRHVRAAPGQKSILAVGTAPARQAERAGPVVPAALAGPAPLTAGTEPGPPTPRRQAGGSAPLAQVDLTPVGEVPPPERLDLGGHGQVRSANHPALILSRHPLPHRLPGTAAARCTGS